MKKLYIIFLFTFCSVMFFNNNAIAETEEIKLNKETSEIVINKISEESEKTAEIEISETKKPQIDYLIDNFKKMKIEKIRLKNDIELILVKKESLPMIMISLAVGGGSSIEEKEYSGITKLLFRSMINGTDKYEDLKNNGGELNYYVHRNFTLMSLKSLKDDISENNRIFYSIVSSPSLERETINSESTLQKAEILEDKYNMIKTIADASYEKLFKGHGYAMTPNGTKNSIRKTTYRHVQKWNRRIINKKNIKLIICGNFNKTEIIEKLNKTWGNFSRDGKEEICRTYDKTIESDDYTIEKSNFDLYSLSFLTPSLNSKEYYSLKLLSHIINSSQLSNDYLSSWFPTTRFRNNFLITVNPHKDNEFSRDDFNRILQSLKLKIEDETTVRTAINQYISEYIKFHGSIVEIINYIATYEMTGSDYKFDLEYPDKIKTLSKDDLLESVEYLTNNKSVMIRFRR